MNAAKNPIVISYLRFSKLEQASGDSTRRQSESRERWLKENNLTLSDSFADEGVSAYRGKNAKTGDLARLLRLIEDGKIPSGSILLVESLDRLSRADVLTALNLFTGIIQAGVQVVTLGDGKKFTKESVTDNPMDLMWSIMVLMRANEESKTKGMRCAANWERKRQQLLKGDKQVATKMMPAWLEIDGNKIVANAKKVATIKRIFALATKGYGVGSITRMLNREGCPTIARSDKWNTNYVHMVLRSRAAIGEFAIHTLTDGKRKQVGTVRGYYPSIIDRRTFDIVQSLLGKRRCRKYGGPTSKFVNIFNGLLFDEIGEPWTVFEKKRASVKVPYRLLVSMGALNGQKKTQINLRLNVFEAAFFDVMSGYYSEAFVADDNIGADTHDELLELKAQIAETDNKIALIQEQMLERGAKVSSVVQLLAKLELQRQQLNDQLVTVQRDDGLNDHVRVLSVIKTFLDIANNAATNEQRVEMQAVVQQLVKRIELKLERREENERQIIFGECRVETFAGGPVDFTLSFAPFTNSFVDQDPLRRAHWGIVSKRPRQDIAHTHAVKTRVFISHPSLQPSLPRLKT